MENTKKNVEAQEAEKKEVEVIHDSKLKKVYAKAKGIAKKHGKKIALIGGAAVAGVIGMALMHKHGDSEEEECYDADSNFEETCTETDSDVSVEETEE